MSKNPFQDVKRKGKKATGQDKTAGLVSGVEPRKKQDSPRKDEQEPPIKRKKSARQPTPSQKQDDEFYTVDSLGGLHLKRQRLADLGDGDFMSKWRRSLAAQGSNHVGGVSPDLDLQILDAQNAVAQMYGGSGGRGGKYMNAASLAVMQNGVASAVKSADYRMRRQLEKERADAFYELWKENNREARAKAAAAKAEKDSNVEKAVASAKESGGAKAEEAAATPVSDGARERAESEAAKKEGLKITMADAKGGYASLGSDGRYHRFSLLAQADYSGGASAPKQYGAVGRSTKFNFGPQDEVANRVNKEVRSVDWAMNAVKQGVGEAPLLSNGEQSARGRQVTTPTGENWVIFNKDSARANGRDYANGVEQGLKDAWNRGSVEGDRKRKQILASKTPSKPATPSKPTTPSKPATADFSPLRNPGRTSGLPDRLTLGHGLPRDRTSGPAAEAERVDAVRTLRNVGSAVGAAVKVGGMVGGMVRPVVEAEERVGEAVGNRIGRLIGDEKGTAKRVLRGTGKAIGALGKAARVFQPVHDALEDLGDRVGSRFGGLLLGKKDRPVYDENSVKTLGRRRNGRLWSPGQMAESVGEEYNMPGYFYERYRPRFGN